MSEFKVGDKVRYKESEKGSAAVNGHKADTIYTVKSAKNGCVFFKGEDNHCMIHRLELAPETQQETFDYKQALKFLAENPDSILEYSNFKDIWYPVLGGIVLAIYKNPDLLYRIKPSPKPTFHWLIKSKGKFAVTSGKYSCEEDVKAGYSYPVEVIQKLED